ncbi:hypothetical protein AVEN_147408-1 [Araneus ventricosus]|uniref:Uncharacterized protein n=1 Tax=Araneus ventricosus TaxID=182803 RepID=A0A4Y2DNC3_ARAVE|nr:hypothetical protein AVEN_147408-1 [Araneus ventricosus]
MNTLKTPASWLRDSSLGIQSEGYSTLSKHPEGINGHPSLNALISFKEKSLKGTVESVEASVMVLDVCSSCDMGPLIRLETTLTGNRYLSICPITYTHSCPSCIPTDWDNSRRTMRHPMRPGLLPCGSMNTLLTLDTSIGLWQLDYSNPQKGKIRTVIPTPAGINHHIPFDPTTKRV